MGRKALTSHFVLFPSIKIDNEENYVAEKMLLPCVQLATINEHTR